MDENELQKQLKKTKKWNIIILSLFAAIVIISIACFNIFIYQHTFTVERWIKAPDDRTKIVDDLLNTHKLIGMTEEEIISLLGEEESYASNKTSFKISKDYFEPENTIVYHLGVDYMDDSWLIISLDNGIVSGYCIDVT